MLRKCQLFSVHSEDHKTTMLDMSWPHQKVRNMQVGS
jgi:hypothetical protein